MDAELDYVKSSGMAAGGLGTYGGLQRGSEKEGMIGSGRVLVEGGGRSCE